MIQNCMPIISNKNPNPKGVKLSSRWLQPPDKPIERSPEGTMLN